MPRVLKMTRDAVRRRHRHRKMIAKSLCDLGIITSDEYISRLGASSKIYLTEIYQVIDSEHEIRCALMDYRIRNIAKQVS